VTSMLFFDFIGLTNKDVWLSHLRQTAPADLENKLNEDYWTEARLIAQKVQDKLYWMSLGSIYFKFAILALIMLIASMFETNHKLFGMATVIGVGGWALGLALEFNQRAERRGRGRVPHLTRVCVVATVVFMIVVAYVVG